MRRRRLLLLATALGCSERPTEPIAMDPGLRFAVREGGRTVGAGVVTDIIK